MWKSTKGALPSLRPSTPLDVETPRGTFSKSITRANPRISSDFEVNRSLFLAEVHPPAQSPLLTQPKIKFSQTTSPTIGKPHIPPLRDQIATSNEKDQSLQTTNIDLQEIEMLMNRIPDPDQLDVDIEDAYRLSPILDRILSTVSDFSPEFISQIQDNSIIQELHKRLFGFIDVDDFLTRSIICRILLTFALDSSSPLLLPISQIFFKLSSDQENDTFFADQSLDEVLLSLVRIAQPEAKIFAAGALSNILVVPEILEKVAQSDILDIYQSTNDSALQIQLLSAIRKLCKIDSFKQRIISENIISNSLDNEAVLTEIIRIASFIDELPKEQKLKILGKINSHSLDEDFALAASKFIAGACLGLETLPETISALIKLLKVVRNEQILLALLAFTQKSAQDQAVALELSNEEIFNELLSDTDVGLSICTSAYQVVKLLSGPNYESTKLEYKMYDIQE